MTSPAHRSTIRGLGPDGEELTDDDILEVDGEMPPPSYVRRAMVTVLPPSTPPSAPASRARPNTSGEYRIVTARRGTLRGTGQE